MLESRHLAPPPPSRERRKLAAVLPTPTRALFERFRGTGLMVWGINGPAWTPKAADFAETLQVMQVQRE